MMNRIAIAFGGGKESMELIEMLKNQKPLLITCFAEDEIGYEKMFCVIAEKYKLKIFFIKNKKGYKENWILEEIDGTHITSLVATKYNNSILKYFKDKKSFDILYIGRKKKDLAERCNFKLEDLPNEVKIKGVEFPLWNME